MVVDHLVHLLGWAFPPVLLLKWLWLWFTRNVDLLVLFLGFVLLLVVNLCFRDDLFLLLLVLLLWLRRNLYLRLRLFGVRRSLSHSIVSVLQHTQLLLLPFFLLFLISLLLLIPVLLDWLCFDLLLNIVELVEGVIDVLFGDHDSDYVQINKVRRV